MKLLHAVIMAFSWAGIAALGAAAFVATGSGVGGVIAVAAARLAGHLIVGANR